MHRGKGRSGVAGGALQQHKNMLLHEVLLTAFIKDLLQRLQVACHPAGGGGGGVCRIYNRSLEYIHHA